jgi:adenylylsulfate reductase subunit A
MKADVTVIGGGTAGIAAAWLLSGRGLSVVVLEKAAIERSGCLAAGVNAINAWTAPGKTPADYARYALEDAHGIGSWELLLTMSERLGDAAAFLEGLGVPFHRNPDGSWASRSWRNLKINGGSIKPLLAASVRGREGVTVVERAHALSLLVAPGSRAFPPSPPSSSSSPMPKSSGRVFREPCPPPFRAAGCVALKLDAPELVCVESDYVVCATGGAAGIYRPNNPGPSGHKMWYPPFNTGGGWAMGIWAGAEMTTLEMRFVALRLQDTAAPTGTLAVGQGASQVNALGETYEARYGNTTSQRVLAWRRETEAGRGPCVMRTGPLDGGGRRALVRSYFHMSPMQAMRFLEDGLAGPDGGGRDPGGAGMPGASGDVPLEVEVQIEGTEPYVIGGHTASGFQVDRFRETTLPGLYACGDAAGGAPQKYVSGAVAEGWIAAEAISARTASGFPRTSPAEGGAPEASRPLQDSPDSGGSGASKGSGDSGVAGPHRALAGAGVNAASPDNVVGALRERLERLSSGARPAYDESELEEAMQKAMDLYAGGRSSGYRYGREGLAEAERRLIGIWRLSGELKADTPKGLSRIWELRERLAVARSLVSHLAERTETRWPGFGEYAGHPGTDPGLERLVNSRIAVPPVLPPEDLAAHPPVMLSRALDRPPDGEVGGGAPSGPGTGAAGGLCRGKGEFPCPS